VPATFISRLEHSGGGPRLAVKDAIDLFGVPTTVGSRVVARSAHPAATDAACLAGFRAAGARMVGKTNLHELCFGSTGVNPWFGTPTNPLDPARVPGGSSSGSAVAVAQGEADIALGTDTLGSIRTPAACCGVVGLKTTWGRISLEGVWPLAPSLDTVGPMGASVARVAQGMALLEPGFNGGGAVPRRIGRVRGLAADPVIDAAVDEALAQSGFTVVDVQLLGWGAAADVAVSLLLAEALASNRALVDDHLAELGPDLVERFRTARSLPRGAVGEALAIREAWRDDLAQVFREVELLALPAMAAFPARLDEEPPGPNRMAAPVSLAGHPALALPVPSTGPLPASIQLVGPDRSEDRLLVAGALVEGAVAAG